MENKILLSHGELHIPCLINVPDDGDIRRIVLGVHGLGGGSGDQIQVNLAEEMEQFHSAAFRFDFPAHGENPMPDEFFTVRHCMDSLITVARYAREQYPQIEDLCIFATGFGAYITLIALSSLLEMPGRVKLVVQTPSVLMHDTLLTMLHTNKVTLRAMDKMSFNTRRPFGVTYDFYKELERNIALTTHPIPMLILHGEEDAYIRMGDIQNFRRINEQSKLVIIPGTSHRFLEEGAWDMVLDLTRDWFSFEQVILADWI